MINIEINNHIKVLNTEYYTIITTYKEKLNNCSKEN